MLDTDTKRRIDTARDILVGKVPDPKSQVEQITIALIYKFMDDMDAEAEELGGKRKFFAGDYARYGWAKLMRSGLGGHETLNLYAEAIAKMPENPGIPPLFRDIFKNAYLPYRDPETLRAFLKIIDEFTYDHSERLGDAFEYLLSVLGSQGDAGQFRTPRHIIDFIVAIVDPKKTETVLDPACGTAGFLISSYKHILKANVDDNGQSTLTPDDKGRLAQNFKGYDISPDMVRLSLVNLYLHAFTDPHIAEYDTLTSQDKWNEHADVILANPPFMSPKGGIKPHNRFSVQSKRSEVLFVDYMAEHLTPGGRAGIIVPEGIIFQSQTAYTQLRKMLVEEYLVAVVSLPAGVFNPYSGVKTSILFLDRSLAKQAPTIAFFKIENDGFGLGAQRREIEKNDLPQARVEIAEYLRRLRARESVEDFQPTLGLVVPKEKIAANGDYNLSGERYRENGTRTHAFPLVPLGEVCTINPAKREGLALAPETLVSFVPMSDLGENRIAFIPKEAKRIDELGASYTYFADGDVLVAKVTPCFENGKAGVARGLTNSVGFGSSEFYVLRPTDRVLAEFVYFCVTSETFRGPAIAQMTGTGGLQRVPKRYVEQFRIPLPPLEVQKEIVAEIEGYQKVIDGARTVLDNYRPHIPIHPDWPMVSIADVCAIASGGTPSKANEAFWRGSIPWVSAKDMKSETIEDAELHISEVAVQESSTKIAEIGSVLVLVRGMGLANGVPVVEVRQRVAFNQDIRALTPKDGVHSTFLRYGVAGAVDQFARVINTAAHGTLKIDTNDLLNIKLPLPPLDIQRKVVAEIEAERQLVKANRDLITRFEKKIQATLARVWGEEAEATPAEEA
ncbi:putative type I restriction enzymeP M protein [Myxococcaceae bacterium]|nr:putative type I restriction enzymeP M protein [Myxococcaceae bacterium]